MSPSHPKRSQKAPEASRPPRGADPLSRRSRARLLAALAAAAAKGDVAAAEALVRLSLDVEEMRRVALTAAKMTLTEGGTP